MLGIAGLHMVTGYEEPDKPFLHHGMLGLLLQLGYFPIVTFVIQKEQDPRLFCR